MKRLSRWVLVLFAGLFLSSPVMAGEHGGSTMEHGGNSMSDNSVCPVPSSPAPSDLRGTITKYVQAQEKEHGAFSVMDERTHESRQLQLIRVHERVGKIGNYYYSCTDMKDVKTGDVLDLDFDIQDNNGSLDVVAVRIHKDNGKPRYTYDDKSNRVPVA